MDKQCEKVFIDLVIKNLWKPKFCPICGLNIEGKMAFSYDLTDEEIEYPSPICEYCADSFEIIIRRKLKHAKYNGEINGQIN
jgi:hypothetical protein